MTFNDKIHRSLEIYSLILKKQQKDILSQNLKKLKISQVGGVVIQKEVQEKLKEIQKQVDELKGIQFLTLAEIEKEFKLEKKVDFSAIEKNNTMLEN